MNDSRSLHLGELPPAGFVARFNAAKRCAELGLRPIVGRTAAQGFGFLPAVKYAHGLPSDHPTFAGRMVQEHSDCDRLGIAQNIESLSEHIMHIAADLEEEQ